MHGNSRIIHAEFIRRRARMKLIVKTPASCSRRELNEFQRLVEMGEEVETSGLSERICRAFLLAFAYIRDSVVGVAGLKNPYSSYRSNVFEKAGLENRCDEFDKELGWVFVAEDNRGKGFSNRLVEAILRDAAGFSIFATSRTDNVPMHKALTKNRFVEAGKPFISERGTQLKIFLYLSPRTKAQE